MKEACPICATLDKLDYKQGPTPIQPDNSTASSIANYTVKQRWSKAIDMHFYWIRDRTRQGQFLIDWDRGSTNLTDYSTKHHPASHRRLMHHIYL